MVLVRVTEPGAASYSRNPLSEEAGRCLSTMDTYMRFLRMLAGKAPDGERILTEES